MGNEIESSGIVINPPIIESVAETTANIAATTNNINSLLGKASVLAICLILVIGIIKFHGCNVLNLIPNVKIAPTIVKNQDTNKTITISPNNVTYTPKADKQNPNPTPIIISKPIEGKVSLKNGEINIQNSGFTIIPKLSEVYVLGDGLQTAAGVRVFFAGSFGIETLIDLNRAFIGIDCRDPIFNLLTTSVGASPSWSNFAIQPYIGESITLAL